MRSSHHNHGNMNGNMTPKCAFSHSRLFGILCFHTHTLCLLNCCAVYIIIVSLWSSDRIMMTGLMIKQQHAIVTSIPATLASRNADSRWNVGYHFWESTLTSPRGKGSDRPWYGQQEIRIWFKHDEQGFPKRLACLKWFIEFGTEIACSPWCSVGVLEVLCFPPTHSVSRENFYFSQWLLAETPAPPEYEYKVDNWKLISGIQRPSTWLYN